MELQTVDLGDFVKLASLRLLDEGVTTCQLCQVGLATSVTLADGINRLPWLSLSAVDHPARGLATAKLNRLTGSRAIMLPP
jgi:hypothetical protein